jgi:hypothetical protein
MLVAFASSENAHTYFSSSLTAEDCGHNDNHYIGGTVRSCNRLDCDKLPNLHKTHDCHIMQVSLKLTRSGQDDLRLSRSAPGSRVSPSVE